MKENQFYCVKCRKAVTVHVEDICVSNIKNKKTGKVPVVKAVCKCGTNLTKFIKRDDVSDMEDRLGKCSRKRSSRKSRKRASRKSKKSSRSSRKKASKSVKRSRRSSSRKRSTRRSRK